VSLLEEKNTDFDQYNLDNKEFKNEIFKYVTEQVEENNKPIKTIKIENDTSDFPKDKQIKAKIESTPQIIDEHYENFEPTVEEIAESEMMTREDRKNK
jgi:hypothetical protein